MLFGAHKYNFHFHLLNGSIFKTIVRVINKFTARKNSDVNNGKRTFLTHYFLKLLLPHSVTCDEVKQLKEKDDSLMGYCAV
jgi:hypothetical protein